MTTIIDVHIFADSYCVIEDGKEWWHIHCNSCQALSINGVPCHETGCPQAWRDKLAECRNCDTKFEPVERWQSFCSDSCYCQYHNLPEPNDKGEA